ncbi:MAG: 3-dehydroquinate synthase [Lachnospiraceae bacterium]|nr:3-dehydroquinate synthase [Lachnospiraceae bacterium]
MESLIVQRGHEGLEFSYEIILEHGFDGLSVVLDRLRMSYKKICIVSDHNVAEIYLQDVKQVLSSKDCLVSIFIFQAGEEHKNLNTVQELYRYLIENKFERKDLLVALGGGVVGDLTGFVAATYLRGIAFIQVPTTLLAQVDSSIGGKTGVDFVKYKNMVGAFYQPNLVYMNSETLQTLPCDQFASGMSEVLKTGLIWNRDFYTWLIAKQEQIELRNPETMDHLIRECCKVKATVIEEDPKEQGVRAILNLGHTLGHAIEKLMNFQMLHGQCVAVGIVGAAYLSYKRGYLSKEAYLQIIRTNLAFRLPVSIQGLKNKDILMVTKSDKKMEGGKIKFVLLKNIGEAILDRSVSNQELLDTIAILNKEV